LIPAILEPNTDKFDVEKEIMNLKVDVLTYLEFRNKVTNLIQMLGKDNSLLAMIFFNKLPKEIRNQIDLARKFDKTVQI
jgi:hypothetical protein